MSSAVVLSLRRGHITTPESLVMLDGLGEIRNPGSRKKTFRRHALLRAGFVYVCGFNIAKIFWKLKLGIALMAPWISSRTLLGKLILS